MGTGTAPGQDPASTDFLDHARVRPMAHVSPPTPPAADPRGRPPLVKTTAAKYAADKKLTARTPADCQS